MRVTDEMLVAGPISRPQETFARVFRLVWRQRFLVASTTFTFAVVSAIVAILLPSRYEAITRLLPNPSTSSPVSLSNLLRPEASALAGLAGVNPSNGEARFLALLHSRVMADRLVDR